MKFKEYINKHTWIITLFWIVVTALITIAIERSCYKIIPDEPIVIKEITDTIIMMHSYDLDKINDSIANIQLKKRLENIELAQRHEVFGIVPRFKNPHKGCSDTTFFNT